MLRVNQGRSACGHAFGLWLAVLAASVSASAEPAAVSPQGSGQSGPMPSAVVEDIRRAVAEKLGRPLSDVPGVVVSVKELGAQGNGAVDDTAAIERTTNSLSKGGIVVFPEGTYVQSRSIRLTAPNIILWGGGAELHGSNPTDHSLVLVGAGSSIIGLTLTAKTAVRGNQLQQMRLILAGDGNAAMDNVIDGAGAVGIAAIGATHFRIQGNTVRNTLADGIHVTGAARAGIVAHNVVRGSQDDLIAVVSYGKGQPASDILIAGNDVAGNPWGRGITVAGGRDITIRDNVIRDVASAAGILIARDRTFRTYGSFNILIERNVLEHIQTRGKVLGGRPRTGHGAIEVYSEEAQGDPELIVDGVLIRDNEIREALTEGVQMVGNVCRIELIDNRFFAMGAGFLRSASVGCSGNVVSCRGNQLDDAPVGSALCGPVDSAVTGASVGDGSH